MGLYIGKFCFSPLIGLELDELSELFAANGVWYCF